MNFVDADGLLTVPVIGDVGVFAGTAFSHTVNLLSFGTVGTGCLETAAEFGGAWEAGTKAGLYAGMTAATALAAIPASGSFVAGATVNVAGSIMTSRQTGASFSEATAGAVISGGLGGSMAWAFPGISNPAIKSFPKALEELGPLVLGQVMGNVYASEIADFITESENRRKYNNLRNQCGIDMPWANSGPFIGPIR